MTVTAELVEAFEAARRLGFLGPGPVADQIVHAEAFARVLEAEAGGPAPFLDLGSGGGLPGLVLAGRWPGHRAVLLDASLRRTVFLRRTVTALGWSSRVVVVEGRAEVLARDPQLRSSFLLVVARSFATPSVTAEIGGAFLAEGGRLAVSEPNLEGVERWSPAGLARLGLAPAEVWPGDGAKVAVIQRVDPVAPPWPRATGIPAKRPLW